jgi:multicomponent K+:H+ antiporter subunit E
MNATPQPRASRLIPHPVLSLVLVVVWLLLVNDVSPRMILLGVIFGLAIPPFTYPFWPDRPRICRPFALARFLPIFLWDVVVANIYVAWLILNWTRTLRPTWIVIPLDVTEPHAITTLANVISLTPGTVSSEIGPGRRTLLVHVLDTDDPDALVRHIKSRYEARLKEIFEC